MNDTSPLPPGSQIELGTLNGYPLITLPKPRANNKRFIPAIFLCLWLVGWFKGLEGAFDNMQDGLDMMLVIWICGWVVAGFFVVFLIFKTLQQPKAERFLLTQPNLDVDGVRLTKATRRGKLGKVLRPAFGKLTLTPDEIATLTLIPYGDDNRLVVTQLQHQKDVELARSVTPMEREWLFWRLANQYGIHDSTLDQQD